VIGRTHHLREERLFDCYVAERSGEQIDPPVAEHLADCKECSARYGEFVRFMDGVRAEGRDEADEIFTPDRLSAQHQLIAKRLELVGRPARIINFPGRIRTRHMSPSGAGVITRWIYGAAAAGLAAGVALGAIYQSDWRLVGGSQGSGIHRAVSPRGFGPVATSGTSRPPDAADDAFLSDLELALEGPGARALQPFDALTPHVREIREQLR
jgi:hypothetical protein